MDEKISLRNVQFGFESNGVIVYSNLNLPYLEEWLDKLKHMDKKGCFLEPNKNLVVVDLNKEYLDQVISQLFPNYISQAKHSKKEIIPFPHHTQQYFLDVYEATDNSLIKKIYARVKGRDSLTEKLTRQYAAKGKMGLPADSDLPFHIGAKDGNGFALVAKDKESRDELEKKVCSHPFLEILKREKHSGKYNAIHYNFIWKKNTAVPAGMVFEVQFEIEKEYHENRKGGNGHLSHYLYDCEKLRKDHEQGPNQIIILQKNGCISEEPTPINLKNKYVSYTLINY